MTAFLVVLGAALGAPVRYLVDTWAKARWERGVVWGTLTVNVVGSWLLGLVAALTERSALPHWTLPLLGVGFCGALTTFSTLAYETWAMLERKDLRTAALNLALSLVLGLAAVALGWVLGS